MKKLFKVTAIIGTVMVTLVGVVFVLSVWESTSPYMNQKDLYK